MSGYLRRLATRTVTSASWLLPPNLRCWSRAMGRELSEIADDRAAVGFAIGCLRAALTLTIAARIAAIAGAARRITLSTRSHSTMNDISARPRLFGLLCGAGAVALGLAYMLLAGAPARYLLVNLAALIIGAIAWLFAGRIVRPRPARAGAVVLALAVPILLTALFGVVADGASRWVSVGPLSLQISLILLPVLIVLYARGPDAIGTVGVGLAALALAGQPDRAMAGVLVAAMIAVVCTTPTRLSMMALAAAMLAFGWTLLTPDTLPASPFVDQVFYTAFDVHPLVGLAVVTGAVAIIMPAVLGVIRGGGDRATLLAFGGCWAGVVIAAALDNYPTPLVGYGGSAVLGYLLSVALLPDDVRDARGAGLSGSQKGSEPGVDEFAPHLLTPALMRAS